jgi:hypothetical protein
LTPTGFGATWIKLQTGTVHAGSCALATGKANEPAIVNTRNIAIVVAFVLFVDNCIFLSPYFYKQENIINRLFL